MIKVLKHNCKELRFKVCNQCQSLLQYKETDIKYGSIKCPHCENWMILPES